MSLESIISSTCHWSLSSHRHVIGVYHLYDMSLESIISTTCHWSLSSHRHVIGVYHLIDMSLESIISTTCHWSLSSHRHVIGVYHLIDMSHVSDQVNRISANKLCKTFPDVSFTHCLRLNFDQKCRLSVHPHPQWEMNLLVVMSLPRNTHKTKD
ncbi:hypothetical protein BgiBS90_022045 [Biomphalaria glabrata]|nr:hypothetical protein BgiBS90_022045 [Biomphalaria glabrata]